MAAFRVSLSVDELRSRMCQRLSGTESTPPARLVWERSGQRVLLHLNKLRLRAVDGWLVCSLELETDITQRQLLQFVFYLGDEDDGDGLNAAVTMNAATVPATQLAERWGEDLQRLLWDAVLDGIEASLLHIRKQQPTAPVELGGFTCANDELRVQVLRGQA